MIRRRTFIAGGLALLAAPFAIEAQQASVPRIGVLFASSALSATARLMGEAFRQGLDGVGLADGRNVAVVYRLSDGDPARYPALIEELVRHGVDVIVTADVPGTIAAARATRTIPIVGISLGDPVAAGFAVSLSRPGGNITGLTLQADELLGKRFELLKEMIPRLTRVAVLDQPRLGTLAAPAYEHAARQAGCLARVIATRQASDFDSAVGEAKRWRADGVMLAQGPLFTQYAREIASLLLERRLPAISGETVFALSGGLMNYGPNIADNFRRAAIYIDKVLKGAKPADLPIEQPTKFELALNVQTAKALGLTIPRSLLLRADQVIE